MEETRLRRKGVGFCVHITLAGHLQKNKSVNGEDTSALRFPGYRLGLAVQVPGSIVF